MQRVNNGRVFAAVFIALLLFVPPVLHADPTQIIVMVESASIRSEPDMASRVIDTPPFGSVFEVEKKVGDWYEVEFTSRVGVVVTGYIHEMFVEVEKEVPEQAPEKEMSTFGLEARVGASFFTGMAGLEFRVKHFALDIGYVYTSDPTGTAGLRYYLKPSPDSWFVGLCVYRHVRENQSGYDDVELIAGIAGGRVWAWGDTWGLSAGLGIAYRQKTERDEKEGENLEEALWPIGDISLRIRF